MPQASPPLGKIGRKRQWSHQNPVFPPDREAQRFKYEPLDPSPIKNEIRLLRLLPAANRTEPLKCVLFHTSLDDAPPYQALSYSWGDSSAPHPVQINEGEVAVTPNLKQALQRLRPTPSEGEKTIWIDAICIDQQNIPERNVQTGKMRSIYRNAEKVLVWLGEESSGSVQAIKLAKNLNACKKEEVEGLLLGTFQAGHYEDIESLVSLFRRQYWWRIWVIQEVACSRESIVTVGADSIQWHEFQNICDIMREQETLLETKIFFKHLSKVRTLTHGGPRGLQLSRFSPTAPRPPLMELLLSHKSKKSTDPRDKVYALVGISDSRHSFGAIDYSLPTEDVYAHTARHIITTSHKLDIVCVKQHNLQHFDLPSWVPDWTRLPKHSGRAHLGLHHHEPPFAAAGDTRAVTSFLDGGRVLKAEGLVLGHLKIGGMMFKKKGDPGDVSQELKAFTEWRDVFFKHKNTSRASYVEFGKVLSCGNWAFEEQSAYEEKLDLIYNFSMWKAAQDSEKGYDVDDDIKFEGAPTTADKKDATTIILAASLMMDRRRLVISDTNLSGLGPWDSREGDTVCVLLGCMFPVILRKVEERYVLIGEAYIYGFMDGEAIAGLHDGKFVTESFEIT